VTDHIDNVPFKSILGPITVLSTKEEINQADMMDKQTIVTYAENETSKSFGLTAQI